MGDPKKCVFCEKVVQKDSSVFIHFPCNHVAHFSCHQSILAGCKACFGCDSRYRLFLEAKTLKKKQEIANDIRRRGVITRGRSGIDGAVEALQMRSVGVESIDFSDANDSKSLEECLKEQDVRAAIGKRRFRVEEAKNAQIGIDDLLETYDLEEIVNLFVDVTFQFLLDIGLSGEILASSKNRSSFVALSGLPDYNFQNLLLLFDPLVIENMRGIDEHGLVDLGATLPELVAANDFKKKIDRNAAVALVQRGATRAEFIEIGIEVDDFESLFAIVRSDD